MLQAIRRPGHGLEALRLNWTTIDDATAIRASVDSLERIPHLLENRRVEFAFGKVLALPFVRDAGIGTISRRVEHLLAGSFSLACRSRREPRFEREQPLLVPVHVHLNASPVTSAFPVAGRSLARVRQMPLEARPASS